jgi:hypothetical protein
MIRGQSVIESVLPDVKIDYEKADELCGDCPYNQLPGVKPGMWKNRVVSDEELEAVVAEKVWDAMKADIDGHCARDFPHLFPHLIHGNQPPPVND